MSGVLEIMQYASPYAGSFLTAMTALAEAQRAQGMQPVFVFPEAARQRDWTDMLREKEIPVYFLPQGTLRRAAFFRRLLRQYAVQVVHTHFIDHAVYVPLRAACFGRRIPHVFHAHSLPRFSPDGRALALRRALMHPSCVICVSDAVRQAYDPRGFADWVTIVNGVDFSRLDAGEAQRIDARPTVLMFGYDFHVKGVDTALEAFDAFDPQQKYMLAVCVASHRDRAQAYLRERFGCVPDRVRLLGPRQDVGVYFRAADVFLSASRTEGLGNAVLEAAYCGRPIVLSDIPAHRFLALPEVDFFPPEDTRALYDAVERACAKKDDGVNKAFVCERYALREWTRAVCAQLREQIRRADASGGSK